MSKQKGHRLESSDATEFGRKSVFDSNSFYEAADDFIDQIPPFHVRKETRYKPDEYKRLNLSVPDIPFITDASVAVVYFIRQSLCMIVDVASYSDPFLFPVVLGLQCFEIDDVNERRRLFDLQFANLKKYDGRIVHEVRKELQIIEERRDLFKRFAAEKSSDDLDSFCESLKRNLKPRMGQFGYDDLPQKFLCQLHVLEMNLHGIKLPALPKRNDWLLDHYDRLQGELLRDLFEFAVSLTKQPAAVAAKYVCMLSTLLFRLISRTADVVQNAMKNFAELYASVTGATCKVNSYTLPLNINFLSCMLEHYGPAVLVAGLDILNQAGTGKAMRLLKRSRKLCYVDALKYSRMDVLRLAFEAAGALDITIESFVHSILEKIDAEHSEGRMCSIRHTCHLLKLLLRDFHSFDSCDSWMYARVLSDRYFVSLKNEFHGEFISYCIHVIDALRRPGAGIWAMPLPAAFPAADPAMLYFALAFRQMCNLR